MRHPKDLLFKNWKTPWHLLLIFAILVGGIFGVGFWYFEHQKDHFQQEMEDQLNIIANVKVNKIVAWRQERLQDAISIFDNPVFASEIQEWYDGKARAGRKEEVLHWLQGLKQYIYGGIKLLDSQGTVRLAIPEGSGDISTFLKDVASEALANKKIIFTDMYRDTNNEISLELVVPLHYHRDGKEIWVGVILMKVNPYHSLYPLVKPMHTFSSTAEIALVRREGNDIVYLNEMRHRRDTTLNLRLSLDRSEVPAVKAALGYEGIVRGVDYRGVPVVAATRTIPGSPWFLEAKIDVSELEGPLRERFQLVALIMFGLMATLGISFAYFWRNRDNHFNRQQVEILTEKEKVLKESEQKLRLLSSQLLMVQEKERHKISIELHDELGQALIILKFQLYRLSKEKEKTKAEFQTLLQYVDGLIENVRRLSRDLSPAALEQFGLAGAIKNLLEEFGKNFDIHFSPAEIEEIDPLFSDLAQVNIYRIFQESLTNIARHAQASQITVSIKKHEDHVSFTVEDNGTGFDLKKIGDRKDQELGVGLTAMQERARLAGGFLILRSQPGAGTRIAFNIPINVEESKDAALSHSVG